MSRSIHMMLLAAGVALAVSLGVARPVSAQQVGPQHEGGGAPAPKAKAAGKKGKKGAAPAAAEGSEAVDAEAAIDKAKKALAEGKPQVAQSLAETVLNSPTKDARNTARAMAVRGEAHLRSGRMVEALADLEGALWVKGGLQGGEREAATAARAQALQQAGVADAGETVARAAPMPTAAPAQPATSGSGGFAAVGNFFGNIFGGSQKAGASPAATASVPSPAMTAPTPAVSSSEPQRAEGAQAKAAARQKSHAASPVKAVSAVVAAAGAAGGGYKVQLAAVRTRAEAEAMAQKVQSEQASIVEGRTFDIEEAVYGNMGRFYRVRIGAFSSTVETQAVCHALRQKGLDCMALEK